MRVIKPDQGCILTINGGSSSIKFALYQTGKPLKRSLYGKVHRIGLPDTNLAFTDPTENRQDSRRVAAALGGLDTLVFSRRHRRKRAGSSRMHLRRTRLPRHRTE